MNEKNQCFKGWETLVSNTAKYVMQSNMKCEDIYVSNLTQNNTNGELYDLKYIDGFEFN